jgi:hypothetical protein
MISAQPVLDRRAARWAFLLLLGASEMSVACGNISTTGFAGSGGLNPGGAGSGSGANPIGAPCVPGDEQFPTFSGFGLAESNIETMSPQCASKICIANHFQGRVTCPYGQTAADIANLAADSPQRCRVATTNGTAGTVAVTVAVSPQLVARQAADVVICSCRCAGNAPGASYCTCPSGTTCTPFVPDLGIDAGASISGSYCLKNGTVYDDSVPGVACSETSTDPSTDCGNGRKNP